MEFTKSFSKLRKSDINIAGGKGASLGEMTQAGIPVPEGFVILSNAFDRFLHETDLSQEINAILEKVDHSAIHTVEDASEKIRGLIESKDIPKDIAEEIQKEFENLGSEFVAARSSATAEDGSEHAWAGQLESFLNTTEESLLYNVRKCWGSLFTPRAIFYRFEKGLHSTEISVAVVIQKMIQSEVSGIAFSVHPITEDPNQLIIEAGFGLGEAIVSGSITPDSYVVEKKSKKIIDKNINTQIKKLVKEKVGGNKWENIPEKSGVLAVLSDTQIHKLADLIIKIEKHYEFPCDIEWAFEDGRFYIVQSRPITTLGNKSVSKPFYKVNVSRDVALATFEVWVESDTNKLKDWLGITTERIILENRDGIITAYEDEKILADAKKSILELSKDKKWLPEKISEYRKSISTVKNLSQKLINKPNRDNFKTLFEQLSKTQGGLAIVYFVPSIEEMSEDEKQLCLKERSATENFFYEANNTLEKGMSLLYPQLIGFTNVVSVSEVIENRIPPIEILNERKKHFIYYNNSFQKFDSLEEVENNLNIRIEKNISSVKGDKINGETAFKGVVQGTVAVVLRKEDMGNVKEGNILVCSMTTPDYFPAMKKAVAFVTDEGGITCHAAIVAREMKKPCIIATKIATQILKTGDFVEVDADNGIVKILKNGLD